MILRTIIILQLVVYVSGTDDGRGLKWNQCECEWVHWKSWSACDRSCFGHRQRTRDVRMRTKPGCTKWEDCAKPYAGSEYMPCNDYCHNGGNKRLYSCNCPTGFKGNCCENQVTCGRPQIISNGRLIGSRYIYGASVHYECNVDYNITSGDSSRTCGRYGLWSGITPRCAFVNMCKFKPCKNGGVCTNLIENYRCACLSGWSGRNCSEDIQPPDVAGCQDNILKFTAERTLYLNWAAPIFSDPLGHEIKVSSNYPLNGFSFPWGDFRVQYTAVKPFNGLSSVCAFNVSVRPNPCQEFITPNNSAVVCSNWKTDYGRFCVQFCKTGYSLMPGLNPETLYVCGASGNFSPSNNLPACVTLSLYLYDFCIATSGKDFQRHIYLLILKKRPPYHAYRWFPSSISLIKRYIGDIICIVQVDDGYNLVIGLSRPIKFQEIVNKQQLTRRKTQIWKLYIQLAAKPKI